MLIGNGVSKKILQLVQLEISIRASGTSPKRALRWIVCSIDCLENLARFDFVSRERFAILLEVSEINSFCVHSSGWSLVLLLKFRNWKLKVQKSGQVWSNLAKFN